VTLTNPVKLKFSPCIRSVGSMYSKLEFHVSFGAKIFYGHGLKHRCSQGVQWVWVHPAREKIGELNLWG